MIVMLSSCVAARHIWLTANDLSITITWVKLQQPSLTLVPPAMLIPKGHQKHERCVFFHLCLSLIWADLHRIEVPTALVYY